MKTINITDIKIFEINILPAEQKGNLSYALLDAGNKEYDAKRISIEKSDFTAGELTDIVKVINIFKNKAKIKEGI